MSKYLGEVGTKFLVDKIKECQSIILPDIAKLYNDGHATANDCAMVEALINGDIPSENSSSYFSKEYAKHAREQIIKHFDNIIRFPFAIQFDGVLVWADVVCVLDNGVVVWRFTTMDNETELSSWNLMFNKNTGDFWYETATENEVITGDIIDEMFEQISIWETNF